MKLLGRILYPYFRELALNTRIGDLERHKRISEERIEYLEQSVIPKLQRELDLERGENDMLKLKLAAWRQEVKADIELNNERIAERS